jgi:hypothetical protein
VWLGDGSAMQDRIPYEAFTVLRLGGAKADTGGLEAAMQAVVAPLTTLTVEDEIARDIYGYDLLLLRPDMHVAWQGNAAPADVEQVAGVVTGRRALF